MATTKAKVPSLTKAKSYTNTKSAMNAAKSIAKVAVPKQKPITFKGAALGQKLSPVKTVKTPNGNMPRPSKSSSSKNSILNSLK